MDFWERSLDIMEKKGYNQSDIGRTLGIGDTTVSYWIRKRAIPRADDALKLADYLGVSLRYLLTGQDKEMPIKFREIVELCRGLNDSELETVCNMLKGLQKRDYPESGMGVV